MNKTILIVGCSMSQIPTFEAAKELGVKTIGVDFNPNAVAVDMADIFEECDIKDEEGVLAIAQKHKVDGIVVPGTDFPVTGAYVSEQMGFPTTSVKVARLCTDKFQQKAFLKSKGFLVPEFFKIRHEADFYDLELPIVVKPNDSMAARGTQKIYNTNNGHNIFKNALKYSNSNSVIAEKFEEGPEISIDALVYNGEVFVFAVADRHFALDPYLIEIGHTMPSVLNKEMQGEVINTFIKAVKTLGITYGAAKGDLKISNRGVMILEIANRISGGVLSGWTVPYATGYYPHRDLIKIHLNEDADFDEISGVRGKVYEGKNYFSAERNFLSIPGVLKEIQRFNLNTFSASFVYFHAKPGDVLSFPYNNACRIGSAVSTGVTREGAINIANKIVHDTLIRLEPNNNITDDWFEFDKDFQMYYTIKKENDWYGVDFMEALEKVFVATGKKYSDIRDNEKFWKYFYKGGVQGATYYIDTYL